MPLRVLNDRVLVKPDNNEYFDKDPEIARILKEGLIEIPDVLQGAVKKIAARGEVITWGSKCIYNYKVGDMVIYGRFSGAFHVIDGVKYLLLTEDEIHGVEEND